MSLQFQAIAWQAYDTTVAVNGRKDQQAYVIKAFGRTQTGETVSLSITDFRPHFYVKVPMAWGLVQKDIFKDIILDKLGLTSLRTSMYDPTFVEAHDFWGFTNKRKFKFIRLAFSTLRCMAAVRRILESETISHPRLFRVPCRLQLYEANIDPYIRFMHYQNIRPCGWVCIDEARLEDASTLETSADHDKEAHWKDVLPLSAPTPSSSAPFVVASFDIECTSSSGEFPVASKTYRPIANQLYEVYKAHVAHGSSDYKVKESVAQSLLYILGMASDYAFAGVALHRHHLLHRASSDIERSIRMKIDDINTILSGKFIGEVNGKQQTRDQIVTTLANTLSELLPGLMGDPIIQIGTTFHRYGEAQCFKRHIITLGGCAPVDGAEVLACNTEEDMLVEWQKLITSTDPDIITGYNIMGFDFQYMVERAKQLNISNAFMRLTRFNGAASQYKEMRLSSSALGDNILRYITMDGRVIIDLMKVVQRDHKLDSYRLDAVASHFLGQNKHDVSPQDIFRLQDGSNDDRCMIARYCLQDCALCNHLVIKLDVLSGNIGMANVCWAPLSYIFMRGQGIKIFSLVMKQCFDDGYKIPVVKNFAEVEDAADSYEGAIVLEPKQAVYLDQPVTVLDYASLYPSSIISENLSHDMLVLDSQYDNLEGVQYLDVSYDVDKGGGMMEERVCRFVQPPDGDKGIIPRILMKLLQARADTRLQMACPEVSPFQRSILDGLQNAYKITANSLYGQIGARTSPIYLKDIAACTTATGRRMILQAKQFLEGTYGADVIYGDTDSVFCIFPNDVLSRFTSDGKDKILSSIQAAKHASRAFKSLLKAPHDLEYDKTFWPFILLSKKRYVGNLYEQDNTQFQQKSMGIVLKRRDNANIVKKIYGGVIDIILNDQNIHSSVRYLKDSLDTLITGDVCMSDLVVTKSLRADYKDPTKIAHKVLAERIGDRDPGNKPQVNDRIPYVFVRSPSDKALQGERIEIPDYVVKNNLPIDYGHYITNQIMKPVLQIYELVLEQLPGFDKPTGYYDALLSNIEKQLGDPGKAREKLCAIRQQDVKAILFDPYLQRLLEGSNKKLRKSRIAAKYMDDADVKPKRTTRKQASA